VAQIIGPALAGVVIAVLNPGWAVVVDGLTYVVSVSSLALVRIAWVSVPTSTTMLQELRHGWSEFWSRTWLWVIVLEFSLVNVLIFAPVNVLGPVIAKQSLGGAPAWGTILAVQGVGSILGGILMLRWRPTRPLLVATGVMLVWAWPLCALALRAPAALIAVGMFFAGASVAMFGALWATTMQREIPTTVLSRVSAYDWFGSLVFLPIGLALIGPISKVCGVDATILGATALLVALVVATLLVPDVTRLRAWDAVPGAAAPAVA
jgi:MFS family permease